MPMARPTSDSLSAGASLVPSPVTATMSPRFFSICTSVNLSCGLLRASTCAVHRALSLRVREVCASGLGGGPNPQTLSDPDHTEQNIPALNHNSVRKPG